MKYDIIIFDCDGVMFDTQWVNRLYYNDMLSHFNLPEMTDAQFKYAHSHTASDAVHHLFKSHSIPETAVMDYLRNVNYGDYIKHMKLNPELKPLIQSIRPPCRTAVATNRSDTMPKVVEYFDLAPYFDRIMTSLDVQHPKPDPEMILEIITHFQVSKDRVLYIGDTHVDEGAAMKSEVSFVAFRDRSLKANFHVDHMSEIGSLIA